MKKDISFVRPEVSEASPDWDKVADCVEGETRVKKGKDKYLPRPNPTDESNENKKRYEHYIERALFFNATGRTLSGMMGLAFRDAPDIKLPTSIKDLIDNVDGAGTPLMTQAHDTLEHQLKTGRRGLLADYPQTEGVTSKADQPNVRPRIVTYDAKNIINWRTDGYGRFTLVVLFESVEVPDDYAVTTVDQWRELYLDGAGHYQVRLWRKSDDTKEPVEHAAFTPLQSNGQPWNEIPFTLAGAVDNKPDIDRAPLFDLACVNIAHYRNSADYEESVFMVGQPTLVIAGLPDEKTIFLGSRSAIGVDIGGDAKLLEASPNTLAGEAMEKKEKQMVSLGARLLTPGEVAKTAEQSRSETAAAHSPLSLACDNESMAYVKALTWAARFEGSDNPEIVFDITADFAGLMVNPQMIAELVKAWQSGALPVSDKNAAFRSLGLIRADKTDEEIAEEVEAEGGGLDLSDDSTEPDEGDE